ncbi:MAG: DNA repair exonuclease [Thaumarchaeota archaeon]|nr:DNA repair exonuclease [Nitrososphaerota archaeon]
MLILHTSDTHLGYAQFDLEEREKDVYDAFSEIIETAVKDRVDAVVHAGDIFHIPKPAGRPLVRLGEGIKTLREHGIRFYFTLGEHDILRMRGTPSALLFQRLGLATYVGDGEPVIDGDLMVVGFHKRRTIEIEELLEGFGRADEAAKAHPEKKRVVVIHQGLLECHPYGEITANDLPRHFDYYAMGHLHDHAERRFERLAGPVCYPGSIDPTPSEGIREFKKGFFLVDLSGSEARPEWVGLKSSRQQFRFEVEYPRLRQEMERIRKEIEERSLQKKPVVLVRVKGQEIDNAKVAASISALRDICLYPDWEPILEGGPAGQEVLMDRPADIQEEMLRLAAMALGDDKRAYFAVRELLPLLERGEKEEALDLVNKAYESSRFGRVAR